MITRQQLEKYQRSPMAFLDDLLIDSDGGPVPLRERMDPWQRQDFEALAPAWLRVAGVGSGPVRKRAYLERPRGHSKTGDIAAQVLWAIAFSQRTLSGVAAAADKEQARLLRSSIDRLVRLNPWLAGTIDIQRHTVVNRRTGSTMDTLSSDAPASYGRLPDFVCCDEITHWSGEDLWHSLLSAAGKRAHCMLAIIANAGWTDTWQRKVFESIQGDPEWYVHSLPGPVASWLSPAVLAEQERLLPRAVYERLWLNVWGTGSGSEALQPDQIERAVQLGGPSEWEAGWQFFGGLDASVKHDATAFCVCARHVGSSTLKPREQRTRSTLNEALVDLGLALPAAEAGPDEYDYTPPSNRMRLVHLQTWRAPRGGQINLTSVRDAIVAAHSRYGLTATLFDPHQAALLAQQSRQAGCRMVEIPFTAANTMDMATAVLDAFNASNVELYREEKLLRDLRALRLAESPQGWRLNPQRLGGEHGDRAVAFALALLGCARYCRPATITRPLLGEGTFPEFVQRSDVNDTWSEADLGLIGG